MNGIYSCARRKRSGCLALMLAWTLNFCAGTRVVQVLMRKLLLRGNTKVL